ncbi:aKG-HExxH-type peptide beta-hydroxylase [Spirobacillus cienkowskii]|uniref:aKG-HExxH-type peptide beta-hydroxylase n=1 Tax=Spirobacillus cienkowskii TaxID=495820 RepID=UPI0030D447ED
MYFLFGLKPNLKNIITICKTQFQDKEINTLNLKDVFYKSLSQYRNNVYVNFSNNKFINNRVVEDEFCKIFKSESNLTDIKIDFVNDSAIEDINEINRINDFYNSAIMRLKELNQEWFDLFDLAIHSIFTKPSRRCGGGTTSAALGVIWLDPRPHWQLYDLMELLIHELTHNLLFYHELNNLIFNNNDDITKIENYSISSILKIKRPLDKVYHSIIVSSEIICAREILKFLKQDKYSVHPPTKDLYDSTMIAFKEIRKLKNLKELLTKNAIELLDSTYNKIERINQ